MYRGLEFILLEKSDNEWAQLARKRLSNNTYVTYMHMFLRYRNSVLGKLFVTSCSVKINTLARVRCLFRHCQTGRIVTTAGDMELAFVATCSGVWRLALKTWGMDRASFE